MNSDTSFRTYHIDSLYQNIQELYDRFLSSTDEWSAKDQVNLDKNLSAVMSLDPYGDHIPPRIKDFIREEIEKKIGGHRNENKSKCYWARRCKLNQAL